MSVDSGHLSDIFDNIKSFIYLYEITSKLEYNYSKSLDYIHLLIGCYELNTFMFEYGNALYKKYGMDYLELKIQISKIHKEILNVKKYKFEH